MAGLLEGVRVLDFGRYIAGPYCAALLADLGADVVRVERINGGDDRYLMPSTEQGEGAQFLQCNVGKRCLAIDMTSDAGREVMRRLIAQADVVVANFSPGALKHFGLDYDALRAIKDDIILTTASAYHSEGPLAERIGFDGVGQAVSGAIWLSGVPGQPFRSATAFVDFGTALSCAYGTLAAIIGKMRTGEGTHVQASLVGTAMAIMNQILIEQATGYNQRVPTGNRSPISGPSDVFAAKDGWFIMQVIGKKMFERWTRIVDRPDLLTDPRYDFGHQPGPQRRGTEPDHVRLGAGAQPRGLPFCSGSRRHWLWAGPVSRRGDERRHGPDRNLHEDYRLSRFGRHTGGRRSRKIVTGAARRNDPPAAFGRT